MWHVLFHCLGFAVSCCHGVLGFISDCSLSWRSVTSEQNKLSISTRPMPGQTLALPLLTSGKVLDQVSLFGSWKPPSINVPQTIGYQLIQYNHLILNSVVLQLTKRAVVWASVPGSNFLSMITRALESLPTQTQKPTKQYPTILCYKQDIGRDEGVERVRWKS